MKVTMAITATVLSMIVFLSGAAAQCCGVPEEGFKYIDDYIELEDQMIIDKSLDINGTLMIEEDLWIENSRIEISGKGIVLSAGATLSLYNSTIRASNDSGGFYLDLVGSAVISNSTLDGCLDTENSFFGLYVEGSEVEIDGLDMIDSGMIRVSGGSINMARSSISGLISYGGNITIVDTMVTGYGLSQIGSGSARIDQVTVSTDLPFSSTAGIYCIGADKTSISNTSINGTFNGGISIIDTELELSEIEIDLPDGRISMELTDLELLRFRNIMSTGTDFGIFISNCSSEDSLENISIHTTEIGMDIMGNQPLDILELRITGSSTGLSVRAPASIVDSVFQDNNVCMVIEDGSLIDINGCSFLDYNIWGIEEETWQPVLWSNNSFQGSLGSQGSHAWWGWVPVKVNAQGGVEVVDAKMTFRSPFGTSMEVYGDLVDLIWAYHDGEGIEYSVEYSITVRRGTTMENVTFQASEGKELIIPLHLTDLSVSNIELGHNKIFVDIGNSGPKANEVVVKVFIDDIEQSQDFKTTIGGLETKRITIEDITIPSGEHKFNVTISSQDEYKDAAGVFQDNNEASYYGRVQVVREDPKTRGNIPLIGLLVILSICAFMVPVVLKRRD